MGTRSYIIAKKDGRYEGVYCHWDGYIEGNGWTLNEHYRDESKVFDLINHGDMSHLEEEVGQCVFYNDEDAGRLHWESVEDIPLDDFMIEYFYLFEDGNWKVTNYNGKRWYPLEDAIANPNIFYEED